MPYRRDATIGRRNGSYGGHQLCGDSNWGTGFVADMRCRAAARAAGLDHRIRCRLQHLQHLGRHDREPCRRPLRDQQCRLERQHRRPPTRQPSASRPQPGRAAPRRPGSPSTGRPSRRHRLPRRLPTLNRRCLDHRRQRRHGPTLLHRHAVEAASGPVTVDYATANGTAIAGPTTPPDRHARLRRRRDHQDHHRPRHRRHRRRGQRDLHRQPVEPDDATIADGQRPAPSSTTTPRRHPRAALARLRHREQLGVGLHGVDDGRRRQRAIARLDRRLRRQCDYQQHLGRRRSSAMSATTTSCASPMWNGRSLGGKATFRLPGDRRQRRHRRHRLHRSTTPAVGTIPRAVPTLSIGDATVTEGNSGTRRSPSRSPSRPRRPAGDGGLRHRQRHRDRRQRLHGRQRHADLRRRRRPPKTITSRSSATRPSSQRDLHRHPVERRPTATIADAPRRSARSPTTTPHAADVCDRRRHAWPRATRGTTQRRLHRHPVAGGNGPVDGRLRDGQRHGDAPAATTPATSGTLTLRRRRDDRRRSPSPVIGDTTVEAERDVQRQPVERRPTPPSPTATASARSPTTTRRRR